MTQPFFCRDNVTLILSHVSSTTAFEVNGLLYDHLYPLFMYIFLKSHLYEGRGLSALSPSS